MPYNGSGTFNPVSPPDFPAVPGTTIASTSYNLVINDLASGLTNALTKDGQTTPTANLPMGGRKHTGVANGSAATDYAAFGQIVPVTGGTYTGAVTFSAGMTTNALTLTGALSLPSTLSVTGTSTLTGAVTCGSTLTANGAVDCNSTFNADGAATLTSTLTVTGAATFSSSVYTLDDLYFSKLTGVQRWSMGANVLDWTVSRYSTGGVFQDSPISVALSTGNIALAKPVACASTLTLSGNAVSSLEAVPKQQLDAVAAFIGARGINGSGTNTGGVVTPAGFTEVFDTSGILTPATGVLTIPAGYTKAEIFFAAKYTYGGWTNADTNWFIYLNKNGAYSAGSFQSVHNGAGASTSYGTTTTGLIDVTPGDQFVGVHSAPATVTTGAITECVISCRLYP